MTFLFESPESISSDIEPGPRETFGWVEASRFDPLLFWRDKWHELKISTSHGMR